jgi:hypothetical protein
LLWALFLVRRLPARGRTLRAKAGAVPKVHVLASGIGAHLLRLSPAKLARRDPASLAEFGHLLETFVVGEEELLVAGHQADEPARLLAQCLATWARLRIRTHWLVTLEAAAQCLAVHGRRDIADRIWAYQADDGFTPATAARRAALGIHVPPQARVGEAAENLDALSSLAVEALDALGAGLPSSAPRAAPAATDTN